MPNPHQADHEALRKQMGLYYTPKPLAETLADWAIQAPGTVLDPSFGGCAFLQAALRALTRVGARHPASLLRGIDNDPNAAVYLQPLYSAGAATGQFSIQDFFRLRPRDLCDAPFNVVLANPPYVRHHLLSKEVTRRAIAALGEAGLSLSGRASYWAYFVLHSLRFLRCNGRLAMVLPSALLHADYASAVRQELVRRFRTVSVLLVQEQVFDHAEEKPVVLLADGYLQPHSGVHVGTVESLRDLRPACEDLARTTRKLTHGNSEQGWIRGLVDGGTLDLYNQLRSSPSVRTLGELATIRIGVVTGANDFFILSTAQAAANGIPHEFVRPIVRRAAYLKGLSLTQHDVAKLASGGERYLLLVAGRRAHLPHGLHRYLEAGKLDGVYKGYKCRSREPWYAVADSAAPGAFLHYMCASWPRVVLNASLATSTNAIHRLTWTHSSPAVNPTRVALGSLSTLTQLSAELVGRTYGGGVLKLEPREAAMLSIPTGASPWPATLFSEADRLLRDGRNREATDAVDQAFLIQALGLTRPDLDRLRTACDTLFARRTITARNGLS